MSRLFSRPLLKDDLQFLDVEECLVGGIVRAMVPEVDVKFLSATGEVGLQRVDGCVRDIVLPAKREYGLVRDVEIERV